MDSLTYYVETEVAEEAEATLHDAVVEDDSLSSVTVEDEIAVIRVTGGELPNQPGVIRSLVDPLAEAGINIHDLITSATSVAIFVAWADREETLDIVHEQF
jgi:aspartate kinase